MESSTNLPTNEKVGCDSCNNSPCHTNGSQETALATQTTADRFVTSNNSTVITPEKLASRMVKLSIDPSKLKVIAESESKSSNEIYFQYNSDICTCCHGKDEEFNSQPQKKVKTTETKDAIDAIATDILGPNTTNFVKPGTISTCRTSNYTIPTNIPTSSASRSISAHSPRVCTCLNLMQTNLSTTGTRGYSFPTNLNFDIPGRLKGADNNGYVKGDYKGWIAVPENQKDIVGMVVENKEEKNCRECEVCVVHNGGVGKGKCGNPLE
ncbi:hypothetical protein BGZ60DRAFT_527284 [Tricladium varicosporioides]|nr:hypothetical protein BGZ60DRAFT_527284 [Hymenoscyphus varicosporioides]